MSPAILGLCSAVAALILVPVIIWFWLDRATEVEHEGSRVLPPTRSATKVMATGSEPTVPPVRRPPSRLQFRKPLRWRAAPLH